MLMDGPYSEMWSEVGCCRANHQIRVQLQHSDRSRRRAQKLDRGLSRLGQKGSLSLGCRAVTVSWSSCKSLSFSIAQYGCESTGTRTSQHFTMIGANLLHIAFPEGRRLRVALQSFPAFLGITPSEVGWKDDTSYRVYHVIS